MHAQASANLRHADQLLQKVRRVAPELGEFVHHDQQMGHGLRQLALGIGPLVLVDVHVGGMQDAVGLQEEPLAAVKLAAHGENAAGYGAAVQVADDARQVRQPLEGGSHAAALEVDQREGHLVGGEHGSQGQDPGDHQLRLARARGACDQAVGAVAPLMNVQHAALPVLVNADGHRQGPGRGMLLPGGQNAQAFRAGHAEQLQKWHHFGQAEGAFPVGEAAVGQHGGDAAHGHGVRGIGNEVHPGAVVQPQSAPAFLQAD